MKPELTIINRLFDDEEFLRLLFDEREKKDGLGRAGLGRILELDGGNLELG